MSMNSIEDLCSSLSGTIAGLSTRENELLRIQSETNHALQRVAENFATDPAGQEIASCLYRVLENINQAQNSLFYFRNDLTDYINQLRR